MGACSQTTNWATVAAARFVEQENAEAQKWDEALQRHQILVAQAPALWNKIREALQTQMHSFNQCVGKEVLVIPLHNDQKLTIYARLERGQRSMTAAFDRRALSVTCSTRSPWGKVDFESRYAVDLNSQDKATFASDTGAERSPEEIASHMLNGLMGWNRAIR